MKFQIEVDGEAYLLDLRSGSETEYRLTGLHNESGRASIAQVRPGVFSVLLGSRSFTVYTSFREGVLKAYAGPHRYSISISDARDRSLSGQKTAHAGPMQVRALMPGRVVKLLVEQGASVRAGQGIIVVEAMKMQNEVKAPKDGIVSKIHALENTVVAAGETLLVID